MVPGATRTGGGRWARIGMVLCGVALLALTGLPGAADATQADATCTLPPLTLPLFGGTPIAVFASPQASPAAPSTSVDEAKVTAALEEIVDCVNTGEPMLVYAVFSPGWFAREFADPTVHYLPAFERMLDTPALVTAEPLRLQSVELVTPRPDGRVEVVATFASGQETWHDTLILIEVDGHWLIDEVPSAP